MRRPLLAARHLAVGWLLVGCQIQPQPLITPEDVTKTRSVGSAEISPDGKHIAYVVYRPRRPGKDEDGPSFAELHVADAAGKSRPFVTGDVNVGNVKWTRDGRFITYVAKRNGDEKKCLYAIPIDGGESRRLVKHDTDIGDYSLSADGKRVAFLAKEKPDKKAKKQKDKGFQAEIVEEQPEPLRTWIVDVALGPESQHGNVEAARSRMLDIDGSASVVHWNPAREELMVALAPTPFVDDALMERTYHRVDVAQGKPSGKWGTEGKIGYAAYSPDGKHVAIIGAEDKHDPRAGRLLVGSADAGEVKDLLPGYEGHVTGVAWRDDQTILYVAGEGVYTRVAEIKTDGSGKKTLAEPKGPVFRSVSPAGTGAVALVGESPEHPHEVFRLAKGEAMRVTDVNPWLKDLKLAKQEVVEYKARDGLDLEGILVHPFERPAGQRVPLILVVHGGPEAHYSNGWLTRYAWPGQLAAARGFAVFYPNYRGSTGRGVKFSKLSQSDYAGPEFDDLVDAIGHLDGMGLVDKAKVGIMGGSYGGFAAAWGATKLTEHFAASVMFVGVADQISKFGTTDIPNEMHLVHSRRWPWEDWDWFRERSPLYHVEKARTPILILAGKDDPRIHPSQSLQMYRYLKTLGKVPVRLVFYPGEGHGNRKAAGRYDYNLRMMRWMEHYLKGPGGDPPPHALDYGLEEDEKDEPTATPN